MASLFLGRQWNVTWSASCRVEAPAMAVQSYPGKAGLVAVAAGEVRTWLCGC